MAKRLRELFEADQGDRVGRGKDWNNPTFVEGVIQRDKERRKEVQGLIDGGKLVSAEDYYHAAMIFQHGDNADDYLKANELARKAMELGDIRAPWLVAASCDRYLIHSGHSQQKYGTQYRKNSEGKFELVAVDPSTTDEERASLGLPPLAEINKFMER